MKLLLLACLAFVQTALGQFGRQQCDYRRLLQLGQQKETCLEEAKKMAEDAMREVQRYDSTCNEGAVELCEKCSPLAKLINSANDLSTQGVLECCMPNRLGGGNRRCEWKDKSSPGGGMGKGKGPGGPGGRGGRGGRGGHGPPPPPGMEGMMGGMDMEAAMKSKNTLGGLVMKGMNSLAQMMGKMLTFCENEHRPANAQAMQQAVRPWKDRLTAKIFSCYAPVMEVATNCTDVTPDTIECLENGFGWGCHVEECCHMTCGPDSLDFFCNAFEQAAQNAGSAAGNNNGFFDPFKFNNF